MNGLPVEVYVLLVGAGLVALAWLLLRFGKIIARWVLIFGVLAVVIIVGLALLSQATATREAATAAKVAAAGQATTSAAAMLCAGAFVSLALVGAGAAGALYTRWRLADRRGLAGLLNYRPHRQRQRRPPEIVYIAGIEDYDDELVKLWGWSDE